MEEEVSYENYPQEKLELDKNLFGILTKNKMKEQLDFIFFCTMR